MRESLAAHGPRNTHRYTEIVNLKNMNIENIIRATELVTEQQNNLTTSYKTA
jgi:hypothetical protein